MAKKKTPRIAPHGRVEAEIIDSLDEEFELELGEDRIDELAAQLAGTSDAGGDFRRTYFTELIRLQRALIKLQDWVVHNRLKVVILFEGRDAAGKGGGYEPG